MANRKHTADEYATALRESRGLVSVAARRLGVNRSSVHRAIHNYTSVAEALEDAREATLDLAEGKLWEAVNDGNVDAIKFLLKTIGKGRGYIERQEHDHTTNGQPLRPVAINVIAPDDAH